MEEVQTEYTIMEVVMSENENEIDRLKSKIILGYSSLGDAPYFLRDDKEFVLSVLKKNSGLMLRYATNRLKNDKEVVHRALEDNCFAVTYASEQIKDDRDFVFDFLKNNSEIIGLLSDRLRSDKELGLMVVKNSPWSLNNLTDKLKDDEDVVLAATDVDPMSVKFASKRLLEDINFAKRILIKNGFTLEMFSEKIKDNEDCVLLATESNHACWFFASERLVKKIGDFTKRGIPPQDTLAHLIREKEAKKEQKILKAALRRKERALIIPGEKVFPTISDKLNDEVEGCAVSGVINRMTNEIAPLQVEIKKMKKVLKTRL